jgi:FAD/FMN-containing dehydrogenase
MEMSSSRERLAREIAGQVFDGRDPAAAPETAAFNTAITHRPEVVVAAASAHDMAAAVRYANDQGLQVAVQATGHGAHEPSHDTVFVSTKGMRGVSVDPVARVARVQAGARWRQVIDAAVPHQLAPLSGSTSTVGVVGYTLGGGLGHLARRRGFAADHVRSVELVTAGGGITTVTAESDPELFWAVRGGQSGFGLVAALEFDLIPVSQFFGGAMIFPAPAIERVLHAFAAWAPTMPEEVTTSVALTRLPDIEQVPPPMRGVVTLSLRFGFTGSPAQGERLLAPMRQVAAPVLDSVGPMSFAAVDRIHMDPPEPLPAVTRGGLLHSMPAGVVDTVLEMAGPDVDVPLAVVEIRLMGGALARPPEVPNAVPGRDGAFSLVVVAPAPPPLHGAAHAATARVVDSLEPWSTGTALVNFVGDGGPSELRTAWTADVLERLRRVKATVDPHDVFGGALSAPAPALAGAR